MSHKINNIFILVTIFMLMSLFVFSNSVIAKETVVLTVEGMADIKDGDIAAAREVAITDSMRKAVEKAVGTMVDSQTKVRNYQLIEDSILTKSKGYVKDYDILDTKLDNGVYFVKIQAVVVKKILKEDLDAIEFTIKRANDPRIMVTIPEEYLSRPAPDPAAETSIIQVLLDAGFRLVDKNQVEKAKETEAFRRALDGDSKAYKKLGNQYNADLLVIGEAFSEFSDDYEGLISCRARVEVRVVKTDSGEILAANGVHESGADITELTAAKKSLQEAGKKMGNYLVEKIPEKLSEQERSIQISINNINFTDLNNFEEFIKGTHLVKGVYIRDFNSGMAKIDIDTSLSPMRLADIISKWEDLSIEVIGLSGSKLELKKLEED